MASYLFHSIYRRLILHCPTLLHQTFSISDGRESTRWTHHRSSRNGPVCQLRARASFEVQQLLYLEHASYETLGGKGPWGLPIHRVWACPHLSRTWLTCTSSNSHHWVSTDHHGRMGACRARKIGSLWALCINNVKWVGICKVLQSYSTIDLLYNKYL
jgi:hypothetical protein